MSDIAEELTPKQKKAESGFSFFQVMLIILLVLVAATYMGETLFGKNSLQVLNSLQKQQKILDKKIKKISFENAKLQKEYLELTTIMGKDPSEVKEP
jgi:cell division protein FtsB